MDKGHVAEIIGRIAIGTSFCVFIECRSLFICSLFVLFKQYTDFEKVDFLEYIFMLASV